MSPTATGRHCAACARTVVDFTLKTDAEILVYLAGAASGRTCGRFAAGQLERPLQRAIPVAPAARWRAWLAAIAALWAVREGIGAEAKAQAATEWRARYWGGPVPAAPVGEALVAEAATTTISTQPPTVTRETLHGVPMIRTYSKQLPLLAERPLVLRGVITDGTSQQVLPGVTVLLKGTDVGTSTLADGSYELAVPTSLASAHALTISVSFVGFVGQERTLASRAAAEPQPFQMQADTRMLGEVVLLAARKLPLAPWHPRRFYTWGKYWLTRPFRRN